MLANGLLFMSALLTSASLSSAAFKNLDIKSPSLGFSDSSSSIPRVVYRPKASEWASACFNRALPRSKIEATSTELPVFSSDEALDDSDCCFFWFNSERRRWRDSLAHLIVWSTSPFILCDGFPVSFSNDGSHLHLDGWMDGWMDGWNRDSDEDFKSCLKISTQ